MKQRQIVSEGEFKKPTSNPRISWSNICKRNIPMNADIDEDEDNDSDLDYD